MIDLRKLGRQILIILILVSAWNSFTSAATITSTASGGNWNNAGSWIGGVVPGTGDDVIITSGATITVSAFANARSLDVSGTLIVNDLAILTIQGDLTIEAGAYLYLSGNTSCTGNNLSILIIYGNYTNYGYSCIWKSWVVIAGNLNSPSPSGIQNNGYLVIGGNAIGIIDQTGGSSVYTINPNATVSLIGTTPIFTEPTSPLLLVAIINLVIHGGLCGFTIDGPMNVESCNGGSASFQITSTTATSPTFMWEENRGTGWAAISNGGVYSGSTTSTLGISNATGMNGYLYRCRVTNASLCSKYSYAGTLTVLPGNTITLTSGAGTNNQTRCINTAITNITWSTTGATGATFTGLPAGVTGSWAANTVTISGSPSAAGTFNYTVTLTGGCGAVMSDGIITVNQTELVAISVTPDMNPVCAGYEVTLTCSSENGGTAPSYQWSVNGINAGTNNNLYSYIPSNNDIVTVVITSNESCVSGNPATAAPVTLTVNSIPSAPAVGTITQPDCVVETGSVVLMNLPSGNWTINPGAIAGNTGTTDIPGLVPGSYSFTVTDSNGCISTSSDEVIISSPANIPSVSVISESDVLCHGGNTGSLTVEGSEGQSPYLYKLGSGAYQTSATFSSLAAGSYLITVQDANLCTGVVEAAISEPDQIGITYSATPASCSDVADGSVTLNLTGGTPPLTLLWSDGSTEINRSKIKAGNYNVVVTDANSCSGIFDVTVGVSNNGECIQIQEIITPNNDGYYDTWKIKNIEMYPDAEVHVYNRWGKLVFTTKNIAANEWDGTMDGEPLPTDSYHYVLYLEKGPDPITGNVTIIR